MGTRYGAPMSPAPLSAAHSLGGYSQHSNYSNATSGMATMTMPRPGYTRLESNNSPRAQNSGLPQANGGAHGHHPSGGQGGQVPRQTSGSRRPDKKDTKEVAWVHWRALKDFLASWIDKESPTARASAREKLTRLTRLQFLELSTDVYDELMRRISVERGSADNAAPFLPVRDDFHPKRNQARQKLATLPKNRFKDLASDVFFELRRRYPEFEEQQQQQQQQHDETSSPSVAQGSFNAPTPQPYKHQQNPSASSTPQREGSGGGAGAHPTHHRKESSVNRSMNSNGGMETLSNGNATERDRLANFTAATNDVVVPNKSRLQEEEIEVPYARDSTLDYDGDSTVRGGPGPSGLAQTRAESTSEGHGASREGTLTSPVNTDQTHEQYFDRMSFASTSGGRKGMGMTSPNQWEDQEKKLRTEYEMRIVTLERRMQAAEGERDDLRHQLSEVTERKKDYEDEVRGLKERATTHASSLRSLQHELDLARDAHTAVQSQSSQTAQQAQEEIQQWRDRCEGLEDELRRVEDEKNDISTREASRAPMDESLAAELQIEVRNLVEELNSLSARNEQLEAEREQDAKNVASLETKVDEYKRQYLAARTELRNLKATSTMFIAQPLSNDHLPASADGNIADTHVAAFQQAVDTLLQAARSSHPSGVLPAMKSIVEAVTNIGEDVKAFEEHPNMDVDPSRLESLKHESTTCLSGLMNASRNHAMASGLSPVSLIDAAAGHLSVNVVELIKLLKIRRSGKTREILNNNRMSIGDMVRRGYNENGEGSSSPERLGASPRSSPRIVSPLNVGKGASSPQSKLSAMPPSGAYDYRVNSFQSATSTAQRSDSFSLEQTLQRKESTTSAVSEYDAPRRADRSMATPLSRIPEPTNNHSRGQSLASHTSASSPQQPTSYDHGYDRDRYDNQYQNSPPSNHPAIGGGSEQEWEDLKPYLNTQSSSLVNAIQSLLAAIRTGGQGPALNEHLSEVIAISTSIVAVSSNALPPKLRATGSPLISDLTANTDRLSEAQQAAAHAGGFDKQLRQGIASASFGVAKALKALMKLE